MTEPAAPSRRRPWWRVPVNTIATVLVVLWLGPRFLPHIGAVFGVESGDHRRPTFRVTTLDGTPVTDSVLRGRVVLVNFWATWCLPCRAEMPLLQAMSRRHKEAGLVVLGLSVDRASPESVQQWLREREITYPVAIVGRDAETAFGGVQGYPTSVLLDRTGQVRYKVLGPLAMASLEPAVRRLLAEPVAPPPTVTAPRRP
ncbi:MAG: TlpA disulfide reductase family protein [Gemmatimonadota bacterium]|nr:TlpA disulfide reductase family protein [Gemmatimonadota bacterium]